MKNKFFLIVILITSIITLNIDKSFAQKQGQEKTDSLFIVLKTAKEDAAKVNTLNALASEFRNNDPDTAIYFANEALAIATKINYKMGIADAYLNPSMALINLGKFEEALKNLNDALKIYDQLLISEKTADKSKILKQKANAYNNIGINYFYQGNYPGALKNFFAALKIYEESGDKQGIANTYNGIGTIYEHQGNYSEAMKNHFASLKIAEEIRNKQYIANSYNNIGLVYSDQGNYPQALKNYFAALRTREEIGDKKGIALPYNNIGNVYYRQGNYPEAMKNYFAALKILEEIGDKVGIASSYNNIGNIYDEQANYSEALKNYFAALKIQEEIGDKRGIAQSYQNIGNIYLDKGNYPEALKNYFTALQIFEKIGYQQSIAQSYINIGIIYTRQKKNSDASHYLNIGLSVAKEIDSQEEIRESYNALTTLDSVRGNFKQAFEHYKMYIAYRDSLVNEENTKKTVQSQMQYEFDKKEAVTKAEQGKKDAVAKAELQEQKVQKYSFIGGAILLFALALVLYNRYRLKQRSNKLLEEKNEVITKSYDDLKKAQGHLVQSEKMASLGQLTAGVAHEINNPINFVSANVKPLKRNYEELVDFILKKKELNEEDLNYNIVESKQLFSGIEEGALRTTEIVKGLRNFSRLDEGEKKKVNINEGIESTLLLINNLLTKKNIEVAKSYKDLPQIECYPGQLNQVFMNIITNAIDAIGENGKITINTLNENDLVKISVRDTGKGMSEEVRQKIFDPFFTTKDVGKGSGLGLSISYGIIEKHNGKIEVKSETGTGCEFVIILPTTS